jgi:annexin A7/11
MELKSLGPLGGDVWLINRACKGAGTHEDLLSEILMGRSNAELHLLKEAYRRTHNKNLEDVVKGELSMKTERLFIMALQCGRDESPYVNQQQVQQDVEALYRAGPGKIGTDEIAICGILVNRSDAHLQAIAQAFPQRHRISLSHMIQSEFSGHMRTALLHIVRGVENDGQGVYRDVLLIEDAMAGMGTKDERLCYRLLRAHWNRPRFGSIKNQYQHLYRNSLRKRVEGETSGKYEKALVGIIEQN